MKENDKFEFFKKTVEHFQFHLGLNDWEVVPMLSNEISARALIRVDKMGKICTVALNNKCLNELPEKELHRIAFHEMAELLLYDMGYLLKKHYDNDLVQELKHEVIRRLEKIIP